GRSLAPRPPRRAPPLDAPTAGRPAPPRATAPRGARPHRPPTRPLSPADRRPSVGPPASGGRARGERHRAGVVGPLGIDPSDADLVMRVILGERRGEIRERAHVLAAERHDLVTGLEAGVGGGGPGLDVLDDRAPAR